MIITPSKLSGTVTVPPSKSDCHRAIICASLARGVSVIENVGGSDDISATIGVMRGFGAKIVIDGARLTVDGSETFKSTQNQVLDCNESGSTLRFCVPLALHTHSSVFVGRPGLAARPLDCYYDVFDRQNIEYQTTDGSLPLTLGSGIIKGEIELPGDISSQFLSGFLFSLPLFDDDTRITLSSPLESKGYVDLTLRTLARFGISIKNNDYRSFEISGGQRYSTCSYICEGDYSQAAFFLAAGAIGSNVTCLGLTADSLQGDKEITNIIKKMGGKIAETPHGIYALPSRLRAVDVDASQIPDLVPILSVLACMTEGETRIYNAKRLRIKESDRLKNTCEQLCALGADISETEDGLIIKGPVALHGGKVSSCNDHRIAMSLAIASTRASGPIELTGAQSVNKSYPAFWQDFSNLGGIISGQ